MLPDALKDYLTACKDQHLTFDALAPQLVTSGYSPDIITQARQWYDQQSADPKATTPTLSVSAPRRPRIAMVVSLIAAFGLFLLSGLSVSAYLIAADKIPFKNAKLKAQITRVVFSLPFVPKTPKIVLSGIPAAHAQVSRSSYDISVAVDTGSSPGFSIPGLSSLDFSLSGYSDISDPLNPRFTMTVQATKDFTAQLRKPDHNLHIKVDKIPVMFTALLGLEPDILNQMLDNWLVIDTSTLETEARKNLDELISNSDEQLPSNEAEARALELLTRIMEEDIAPDLKMVTEDLDGSSVYKITYQPAPEDISAIASRILLEYDEEATSTDTEEILTAVKQIKAFTLVFYVDRKASYLRRADVTFTIEPDTSDTSESPSSLTDLPLSFTPPSKVAFSIVLKLSDFGQDLPIDVPLGALTPEEFLQKLYDLTGGEFNLLELNPSIPPPAP